MSLRGVVFSILANNLSYILVLYILCTDFAYFIIGCEKMYLAPYILLCLAFAASLVAAVRAKNATDANTKGGTMVRAILTLLLLAFVGALWYYTDEKFIKNENIERWVRIISSLAFLGSLPEIWIEKKKEE